MPRLHKVRFLDTHIVQDEHRHNPEKQTVFRAGEVHELSDASLQHWLVRARIEILTDAPQVSAAKGPAAPPPPAPEPTPLAFTTSSAPSPGESKETKESKAAKDARDAKEAAAAKEAEKAAQDKPKNA